nr:MAG TPA: hypothetical protein [Caudoviricetes sp.]
MEVAHPFAPPFICVIEKSALKYRRFLRAEKWHKSFIFPCYNMFNK